MKSVRLNDENRERIVKVMLVPLDKKEEEYRKNIGGILQEVIERNTPLEVWEFTEKYPELIGVCRYVNNPPLLGVALLEYSSYPVTRYIKHFTPNWNDESIFGNKADEIRRILRELRDCQKERKIMKNKLVCVLSHIRTSKQLQEQFPEAYEAFKSLYFRETEGDKFCDSVEKLRAEFNKAVKS